jgi:hypothetical protein
MLTGISSSSIDWTMDGNTGIPNANADGLIGFTNNATTTSVSTVWIMPAGTYSLGTSPSKFDMPSNGVLRYIGKTPAKIRFIAVISARVATGTISTELGIVKNGAASPPSGVEIGFTSYTSKESCTVVYTDATAVMNDTYNVVIRRNTAGTSTFTVEDIQLTAISI